MKINMGVWVPAISQPVGEDELHHATTGFPETAILACAECLGAGSLRLWRVSFF
jgi:hypothetical protein